MADSSQRGCVVACHLGGVSRGGEEQAARAVRPALGRQGQLAGVSLLVPDVRLLKLSAVLFVLSAREGGLGELVLTPCQQHKIL